MNLTLCTNARVATSAMWKNGTGDEALQPRRSALRGWRNGEGVSLSPSHHTPFPSD